MRLKYFFIILIIFLGLYIFYYKKVKDENKNEYPRYKIVNKDGIDKNLQKKLMNCYNNIKIGTIIEEVEKRCGDRYKDYVYFSSVARKEAFLTYRVNLYFLSYYLNRNKILYFYFDKDEKLNHKKISNNINNSYFRLNKIESDDNNKSKSR